MESWKRDAADDMARHVDGAIVERLGSGRRAEEMRRRLDAHLPSLFDAHHRLYGWRWDFGLQLEALVLACIDAAAARSRWLRHRDRRPGDWLTDPATIWAMTYVDRFSTTFSGLTEAVDHLRSLRISHLHLMPPWDVPTPHNDGGYAVQSYRSTRPDLGTIDELSASIHDLSRSGIGVVLDFVANHTADTHPWALAAAAGDDRFRHFYFLFPDREVPDQYAATLRSIFPDRPGDAFTWREDVAGGCWVWSTFYANQWDLDYRNPDVTTAMVGELLHVANLGPAVIRADATPFLWKRIGTPSENLDEAHLVVEIFARALDIAAPSTRLLSEAIVHPDDVVRYVRPEEAELGYNPLIMSSIWEAMATRDVSLLERAMAARTALPEGCEWVTYLRCHDDIGWGFADEDAIALGMDPFGHRVFLNDFYSGTFDGSFGRGLKFQENPETGDARISGTLASLAGLQAALESADGAAVDRAIGRILMAHAFMLTVVGIPLMYLGDEVGQFNDLTYERDPERMHDNRWAHRPSYPWETLAFANDATGAPGRLLHGLRSLLDARVRLSALGGDDRVPHPVATTHESVTAFVRRGSDQEFLGVFNFSERTVAHGLDLGGWSEVIAAEADATELRPYAYGWYVRDRS